MNSDNNHCIEEILNWCKSVFGWIELISDDSRDHPGQRSSALRLRTSDGPCYVKLHSDFRLWENEAHGYEQWAALAFGDFAPQLLAVRDESPLALVISELPGKVLEEVELSLAQKREVWRTAGRALAGLHNLTVGSFFGPCRRDGTSVEPPGYDAPEYIMASFKDWHERGLRRGFLREDDLAILRAAENLIPAFNGVRSVPCHRDYCPANWLVAQDGGWAGVIDFEFSYWDVPSADFTRFPDWEWIHYPDLMEAFYEGYGKAFTHKEEQQILVSHVLYDLGAIVWGQENAYYIYAEEGRQSLKQLGKLI